MHKKKKILAILPTLNLYGKERSNIEVYNLLNKQDDIDLLVAVNNKADKKLFSYVDNLKNKKILIPYRHYEKHRTLRYLKELFLSNIYFLFLLIKIRPGILFICSENTLYDFALPILFSRTKIVYRIGDAPSFSSRKGAGINSWLWNKLACKRTHTFVSISDFIKKEVVKTGRNNPNDQIIYNYPPNRIDTGEKDVCNYYNKKGLKVGYIGQIIEEKGIKLFVEAAAAILNKRQDVIFYIAGSLDYDPAFSALLMDFHNKLIHKNNIIFLGEVENISRFFSEIDILCVPSLKQEPLGNVLVEAKQFSKACVIFNSGGMPELIRHKENGYICSSPDSDSLREGIEYYLDQPDLASKHGESAYKSILDMGIDYENYKKKWLNVFNSIK